MKTSLALFKLLLWLHSLVDKVPKTRKMLRLLRAKPFHRFTGQNTSLHLLHGAKSISQTSSSSFAPASAAAPNAPSLTVYFLKNSCGLSPDAAIAAAKRVQLKTTRNSHSVLALLKDSGFSQPQIARLIAARPQLLLANPSNTLKPKLDFYRRIGLSDADLPALLSKSPHLFLWSVANRLEPNVKLLGSILGDHARVLHAIQRSPSLLSSDLNGLLPPRIEALKNFGVPESLILTLLNNHPKALIEPALRFKECFEAIKEMGINPSKSTFSHAFAVLSVLPKPKWERKLENFRNLGWSEEQVIRAFTKHPYCMSASDEKIKQKMEFFAEKLKWRPDYVSMNPVILSLSFEKRILPRYLVLKILQSKGLLMGTTTAGQLMLGNKQFLEKFVMKYQNEVPELGVIHGSKVELEDLQIKIGI